jgi:hypothetical protein
LAGRVGAVATQSFVEVSYGPKGLALMRDGMAAPDAMNQLIAADKQSAVRQLGFVDANGHAASHTGANCIQFAGSHVGEGYAVQANIMGNAKVVDTAASLGAPADYGNLGGAATQSPFATETAGTGTPSLGPTLLPSGQTYATAGNIFRATSRTLAANMAYLLTDSVGSLNTPYWIQSQANANAGIPGST